MALFDVSTKDSKPEKMWENLGTFFTNVNFEERGKIEAYWEALSRVLLLGQFNLRQILSTFYLNKETPGTLEEIANSWEVVFEDLAGTSRQTASKEFLASPQNIVVSGNSIGSGNYTYAYRVSAVNSFGETLASQEVIIPARAANSSYPITISWGAVSGASAYNVYGRSLKNHALIATTTSLSYVDSTSNFENSAKKPVTTNTALKSYLYRLDSKKIYLSIPELLQNGAQTLVEGTDYEIVNYNSLRFFADAITQIEDITSRWKMAKFYAPHTIILTPVLYNIYFKIFGIDRIQSILAAGEYSPHIKDFVALTSWEKAQAIGNHLKYFCWAYSYYIRREPSFKNLQQSYAIANDYPFAYEAGTCVWTDGRFIKIRDAANLEITYDIGLGNNSLVVSGQSIAQFSILCSGIGVRDWYTNPNEIEALVDDEIEEKRLTVQFLNGAQNLNPNQIILDSYKKLALPIGLNVKE